MQTHYNVSRTMKQLLLFLISVLTGIICTDAFIFWEISFNKPPITPLSSLTYSLAKPPKNSQSGFIASMSGIVNWQSRIATQPAQIITPRVLQQGENIYTMADSQLVADFQDNAEISLLPKTEVDIIQTLPVNYVFSQPKGSGIYTVRSTIPVSVRTLHLLVTIISGQEEVSVDPEKAMVTLHVSSGSAKAAYNDSSYTSTIVPLTSGNRVIFLDDTRTITVKTH